MSDARSTRLVFEAKAISSLEGERAQTAAIVHDTLNRYPDTYQEGDFMFANLNRESFDA
jgi:hypothetical protein